MMSQLLFGRGALSFLAFTFLSLAGAAVHSIHPLPPRPLFSRPRDQSICLPQKTGLLSKLARVMTRAFLEFIFFSVDGRRKGGRKDRFVASSVGITVMGRIRRRIVIPCSRSF